MLPKSIITAICCIFIAAPAHAEAFIKNYIPEAKITGSDRYTYMLFDIYDATLYAPKGQWEDNKPFALSLKYLRSLKGEKIAARSAEEMRKQGFKDEIKLAGWYSQMNEIFPNVTKGTNLTGVLLPNKETVFYKDNKRIGTIKDPEFGKWFFGIWLAHNTTAPTLRQNLIGQK